MAFGLADSLQYVFLATKANTQKAENMIRSPLVSILWDDRTGQLQDHAEGMLVTASGVASLTDGAIAAEAQATILSANPNFGRFVNDPATVLFAVDVLSYDVVVGYGSPIRWCP